MWPNPIDYDYHLVVLGICIFFAGLVDALAGGGGLISLPAYLAAGLNPALALGTNKLSSSIGAVVSAVRYHRHLKFPLKPFLPAVAASLIGSWLGARLAIHVDSSWLRPFMLVALPIVAYFVWYNRDFGAHDHSEHLSASERTRRGVLVAAPIGAYDGFFGPGAGTFFAIGFSRWGKYDLLGATARAKILNLVSNIGAAAAFLLAGRVELKVGLAMGVLSVAGHWVGSHLGIKQGAKVIRPVVALVCAGLFLKILLDVF